MFLAVVKAGQRRYGLIVDQILNPEEVVVKPMHGALKALGCFSGATILPSGRIALVLNAAALIRSAISQADGLAPASLPATTAPLAAKRASLNAMLNLQRELSDAPELRR